jgi:hypothetical protein
MKPFKNILFITILFPLSLHFYFLLKVNSLYETDSILFPPTGRQQSNSSNTLSVDQSNKNSRRKTKKYIRHRDEKSNIVPPSQSPSPPPLLLEANRDANLSIPVFYNLFTSRTNASDVNRVRNLVFEQLASLRPEHHPVYVHSIGRRLHITNTTLVTHQREGSEMITLHSMWEYCQRNKDKKIVYLHSKGSFHDKHENDLLRNLMTLGALSKECAYLPSRCNVCASRFSPFPHPHTPGNMFLARCDYVARLIDPTKFPLRMNDVPGVQNETVEWRYGSGRFSSEHWIGSAPTMKPCDLYNSGQYAWGYTNLPEMVDVRNDFKLLPAPRFPMVVYKTMRTTGYWATRLHRLEEYQVLYNEQPDESWWGRDVQFPK